MLDINFDQVLTKDAPDCLKVTGKPVFINRRSDHDGDDVFLNCPGFPYAVYAMGSQLRVATPEELAAYKSALSETE